MYVRNPFSGHVFLGARKGEFCARMVRKVVFIVLGRYFGRRAARGRFRRCFRLCFRPCFRRCFRLCQKNRKSQLAHCLHSERVGCFRLCFRLCFRGFVEIKNQRCQGSSPHCCAPLKARARMNSHAHSISGVYTVGIIPRSAKRSISVWCFGDSMSYWRYSFSA